LKKIIYNAIFSEEGYPFEELAEKAVAIRDTDELKEQDSFLIVWGGADINPTMYGHPMHPTTYPGGLRDRLEWSLMSRAKEMGIPIIGVCRGAQMACALSGGFLLQDVENHAGANHYVRTIDNQVLNVNSIHHQMMNMTNLPADDYELVAWREGRHGAPYGYRDDKVWTPEADWKEPEFVYFKKTRAYAIQWHPEGMARGSDATQYVLNYIKKTEKESQDGFAFTVLSCDC
jgi:gamma-glutamyl-gamma-aminobutyrate hydrolase PuuD